MCEVIEMMESRLDDAKYVVNEFRKMKSQVIGDYLIADDGDDRWIIKAEDYDDATNSIAEDILDGKRTLDREDTMPMYDRLCHLCPAMYSRTNMDDLGELIGELECNADQAKKIYEALGVDNEGYEIVTDDGEPDDLNQPGYLWVVSTHTLIHDGAEIVEWTRCSCGHYGDQGRSECVDQWTVEEDTDGGDTLPGAVAGLLLYLGLEDNIPDVPEPQLPSEKYTESPDGQYAVYWETVGDDERPVARYDSLEAAQEVCAEYQRSFDAANPSGGCTNYLCGYGVREWTGEKWEVIDDEPH